MIVRIIKTNEGYEIDIVGKMTFTVKELVLEDEKFTAEKKPKWDILVTEATDVYVYTQGRSAVVYTQWQALRPPS